MHPEEKRREETISKFRDLVQQDINRIFFNVEEFGEPHRIDGEIMDVVEDSHELLDRMEHRTQHIDFDRESLYREQKLIYVKQSQFGNLPRIESVLNYDGIMYRVINATDECGIYSISLEAYQG